MVHLARQCHISFQMIIIKHNLSSVPLHDVDRRLCEEGHGGWGEISVGN